MKSPGAIEAIFVGAALGLAYSVFDGHSFSENIATISSLADIEHQSLEQKHLTIALVSLFIAGGIYGLRHIKDVPLPHPSMDHLSGV